MFKSIRWKFITIYFLLVFIAMIIVGVFIVNEFEELQIEQVSKSMNATIKNVVDIIKVSTKVREDDWKGFVLNIQDQINTWPLSPTDKLYILSNINPLDKEENEDSQNSNSDTLKIVAINPSRNDKLIGVDAYSSNEIDNSLLLEVVNSKNQEEVHTNSGKLKHIAYPYVDDNLDIKVIIYIKSDLRNIISNIKESKKILINATLLALIITVVLGFIIAKSITEPIKDVTIKAEKMAKGDFHQYVEIKSDDEIGQLASMFNFLTEKLKDTLSVVYSEKSKMETIFTYMADGVIATDTQGNILHANPVALNVLKISKEEISTIKYDDIFNNLNDNMTLTRIKQNENWQGSEILKIGQEIFNAKYVSFKNENEEIGGLIVVLQNVTEQQKLENMRKEFVANVSHELKTPLTTIKSYTETILDGVLDDKETSKQFLTVINEECDRMNRIVRDLLRLSSLDFKQVKWNMNNLSVNKLLNSAYMKLKMPALEKSQIINIEVDENTPEIIGDKDGIEQVLLNIISNAIKYTGKKGIIDIKAYHSEGKVTINVKDNGMGIPKEDLDRIFERFYRVDKARSRELGGTGLGLSIAKQIINAHGGDILIKSVYNEGTCVEIIIPASIESLVYI